MDAPASRGSVINIHANGPVVYGLERYRLFGAEPSTTYQVTLTLYADEGCKQIAMFGEQELRFPTAALTTNGVGNGHAKAVFSAQQVAPLVPSPPPPGRAGPCGGSAGAERLVVRAGADSVGTVRGLRPRRDSDRRKDLRAAPPRTDDATQHHHVAREQKQCREQRDGPGRAGCGHQRAGSTHCEQHGGAA